MLTKSQLENMAFAMVQRCDKGDILPALRYIVEHHYGLYMKHMHEIINTRRWDFQGELESALSSVAPENAIVATARSIGITVTPLSAPLDGWDSEGSYDGSY